MRRNRSVIRFASVFMMVSMSVGLVPFARGAAQPMSSAVIDGRVGGQVTCQSWMVDVPAGAFNGVATVSMTAANSADPTIEVSISDPSLNKFQVPVLLRHRGNSPRGKSIFWWDPASRAWVRVPTQTTNYNTNVITAYLQHFSTYSVKPTGGKAGW